MAYHNQDNPLHHFTEQQQPTSDPHHSFQTAPNWLNNALLRNLDTNVNATATNNNNGSQSSGQWLSRPILHRNHSEVIDDVTGAGMKAEESGEATAEGVMNWQKAKHKGEIMAHPLYEQLLSAHVSCLRIATPVDQLPRIDAQLAESQNVVAKYSALGQQGMLDNDDNKQLDHFMSHYVLLLCSFKEQLQQHVRVHAMEAVMACWEIEQSLQSLTGVSPGEGTGATMSEDEDEQVDSDVNLFDGGLDGSDNSMGGFGPLVLTENERSLMERVRHELKHELKQGYKEKIVDIREEILRKRRAGKLPGDTTSVLKDWWQSHSKWPYPTEEDKARLVQETGLQLKQINNWFINQRKRNWHSNPSTSNALKSKRKSNAGDKSTKLENQNLISWWQQIQQSK
ncbi:homeobox protein knotted-1-like 3 isoform X1 [Medicago truncatula]|uniref:homeobox protein knotted-1-like 3 isoform X1 n=1 Tax=Medicago truncatula TaxID=3880 RepID=UPI000D2F3F3F|nr:homeobox protein knotted-1-like 3 isoform X1 [Medicago truncatula]